MMQSESIEASRRKFIFRFVTTALLIIVTLLPNQLRAGTVEPDPCQRTFLDLQPLLKGLHDADLAWADYDLDGDLDLLLTGEDQESGVDPATILYQNRGGGSFAPAFDPGLIPLRQGSADWADYDGDGDPDLLLTGNDENTDPVTALYRNEGGVSPSFTLIDVGLTNISTGQARWGDYDGDGDPDIALTGNAAGTLVSKIYRNDGSGVFTDIDAGLLGFQDGVADWADYDADGDLDLLLTGFNPSFNADRRLYRNNGDDTFTDQAGADIAGVVFGDTEWADIDLDGDLDLALTGRDSLGDRRSDIYRNNGGTFTVLGAGLEPLENSRVAWADYDLDGDPDLVLSGQDIGGNRVTLFYRNDGFGVFTEINAGLVGVQFGDLEWVDLDGDGDPELSLTGASAGELITTIYRNQGGNVFHDVDVNLDPAFDADLEFADYDLDGDPDLLLTGIGESGGFTRLYRNQGGAIFFELDPGFAAAQSGGAAWADYDMDGDPDVVLSGRDATNNPSTVLYRNDGAGVFTSINAGIIDLIGSAVAWADYDLDGDPDLAILGEDKLGEEVTRIYRNEGGGSFTDIAAGFTGLDDGDAAWADYDLDGDPDLVVMGVDTFGTFHTILYRNDGSDVFTDVGAGFSGVALGSVAWADYDLDGAPDLLLVGLGNGDPRLATIYRNNGDDTFTDVGADLTGIASGMAAWGDFDGDGDPDILITGASVASAYLTDLYRNDGGGVFTLVPTDLFDLRSSTLAWADVDLDGDLDVALAGQQANGAGFAAVYWNAGDCNGNGLADECEIASGDAEDVNINGVPDECDVDCNENGVPDDVDIADETSQDCNLNGVPDECELESGDEEDCNENGVLDSCDIAGDSDDLNSNNVPDECDVDCNENGVPDDLDIADETSADENLNGVPDECEVDCNGNGIDDDLDLLNGTSDDCNENAVPDECDIESGRSDDENGSGVPDECEGNGIFEVLDLEFGGNAQDWTGRKFEGNGDLGGSWEVDATRGLCMSVGAGGQNGVEWRSPSSYVDLVMREVYRIVLVMETDQLDFNQLPVWDWVYVNSQGPESVAPGFLNYGGRRWVVATEGGANGITGGGPKSFEFWFAPAAVATPQWNDLPGNAFTTEADAVNDMRFRIRVLDFDESLQASQRSGAIYVSRVQVSRLPLETMEPFTETLFNEPISEMRYRAYRPSTAVDPAATAEFDEVDNTLTYQLPSADEATVDLVRATLGPNDSMLDAFIEDPGTGSTVRNPLKFFPAMWESGKLYRGRAAVYAASAETDPIDIIDVTHDVYTTELGGSDWVTSGDESLGAAGMAGAGSPKLLATTEGAAPYWHTYFYGNTVTASLIENADRWRMQVDFFNRPDIGVRSPKDETGGDSFVVDDYLLERINIDDL